MMKQSNVTDFSGPMVALITPFKKNGEIDYKSFNENIVRLMNNRATGVIVAGCTGEFWSLTFEEKKELFKNAKEITNNKCNLICGCSAITLKEVLENVRLVEEIQGDACLILPSYFVQLTEDEIFNYYEIINNSTSLPIVVYNIPQFAYNEITPSLMKRLKNLKNVKYLKESCGRWDNFLSLLKFSDDKIKVFCGPSSVYGFDAVKNGTIGTMDCFANVWLPGAIDLFYESLTNHENAQLLQDKGKLLTKLFTSQGRTLYPSTKAAMNILGYNGGYVREPLLDLDQDNVKTIEIGLKELMI